MGERSANNPSYKLGLEAPASSSDGLLLSLPHVTQAARAIICTPLSDCSVVREVVQVTLPFITCRLSFWVWARCRLSFSQAKTSTLNCVRDGGKHPQLPLASESFP